MKTVRFLIAATVVLLTFSAPALAHDVPNMSHSHAFKQTGYGTYRQGHYVNGPQGSIIIYSAKPYTGYQNGAAVKFARPKPITRAPGSTVTTRDSKARSTIEYGKR